MNKNFGLQNVLIFSLLIFNKLNAQNFTEINRLIANKNITEIVHLAKNEQKKYVNTKIFKHKLNYHYLIAFSSPCEISIDTRITNLLWVVEHSGKNDFLISAYSNYHLASLLISLNSNQTARTFAKRAVIDSKKCSDEEINYLSNSMLGTIYYNLEDYTKAIDYYEKSINYCKNTNKLFYASLLNNISLCKLYQNNIKSSNLYLFKSLEILNSIPRNKEVDEFKIIVEGNLGSNYLTQKKFKLASELLEKEINLYQTKLGYEDKSLSPFKDLLELYNLTNDQLNYQKTILRVKQMKARIKNRFLSTLYSNLLFEYSLKNKNIEDTENYGNEIISQSKII